MRRLLATVTVGLLIAACDGTNSSSIPTAPSPPPPPAAAAPPLPLTLTGYVGDTAYRVLAGVTVEVTQGPDAGTVMTSDADGRFSYTGTFATPVTLRATKDGYIAASATARVLTSGGAYAYFQLSPVAPPVAIAGNYTLTITADPACTGLPDDVRTRTYSATVTPNPNATGPANTAFNGIVTGGQFAPHANIFWVGVAGGYVAVSTEGEGPSIVEQVGTNRYIAFTGNTGVTVDGPGVSTISAAFRGQIEYCELKGPIVGGFYDCRPELAAVREHCTSNASQLTLSRR